MPLSLLMKHIVKIENEGILMTDTHMTYSVPDFMPPRHKLQVGSTDFKFDIITSSQAFQAHVDEALYGDLFRDICDDSLSELSPEEIQTLSRDCYQNIVQKSPTWLALRSQAHGTASSVGKYIKGPTQYPNRETIMDNWRDKISHKPFNKTHTMSGHMNWGVGYEDPALVHFAIHQKVSVAAVGTIRLDLEEILELGRQNCTATHMPLDKLGSGIAIPDAHLLISPDGVVGKPEPETVPQDNPSVATEIHREVIGMLEIKCISPFHHVEVDGEFLEWIDNMELRQWYKPQEIPFVYIMQIGLQAMVGLTQYGLDASAPMWFIRWSPHGLSNFCIEFGPLIRLGVSGALLYLSLLQRIKTDEDIDMMFPYKGDEIKYEKMMRDAYQEVMTKMTHEYVQIDDYPEFDLYYEITKYFQFKVGDINHSTLQTFPAQKKDDAVHVVGLAGAALDVDLKECVL